MSHLALVQHYHRHCSSPFGLVLAGTKSPLLFVCGVNVGRGTRRASAPFEVAIELEVNVSRIRNSLFIHDGRFSREGSDSRTDVESVEHRCSVLGSDVDREAGEKGNSGSGGGETQDGGVRECGGCDRRSGELGSTDGDSTLS